LEVNQSSQPVPSLSPLYLTSIEPFDVTALLSKWTDILVRSQDGNVVIKGENDTFIIKNLPQSIIPSSSDDALETAVATMSLLSQPDQEAGIDSSTDRVVDYDKIVKHMLVHTHDLPTIRDTPSFNHSLFYSSLERYLGARFHRSCFGKFLLYGQVVTSTSTILEKYVFALFRLTPSSQPTTAKLTTNHQPPFSFRSRNHSLLRTLPTGFTMTASTQVSGRGRGSNVWVSPPGSLMFSTVIWHPAAAAHASPVVFVQYLAAMAIVRAARSYARGYDAMPLHLKWPNDVYAEDRSIGVGVGAAEGTAVAGKLVKVAGVLVNSTYAGDAYGLVVGCGVNVANAAPTTGLDRVAAAVGLPPFERERLLARILATFDELYSNFCAQGWGSELETMYYDMWLHRYDFFQTTLRAPTRRQKRGERHTLLTKNKNSHQIVTLETEGGLKARIKGITRDWGLLVAEELGWEDRPTGRTVTLQSDSNSFDFFKGLVKKKI
jgi:biotin--protein ligase